MGDWPNYFALEDDDLLDRKFIESPVDQGDIADLQYLIDDGEWPDDDKAYRVITEVGLKKLVYNLSKTVK